MDKDILEILASYMTKERFDRIATEEKEFLQQDELVQSLTKQLQKSDMTAEQRLAVDRLLTANNESNSVYSQLAYVQGMKDCANMLRRLNLV